MPAEALMRKIPALALLLLIGLPVAAAEHKPYTRNVAIVIYENAEPLDWAGPYEVYVNAARAATVNGHEAFNVYIVSKTGEPVSALGLKVLPNYSIANAPKPDIVVFPGGRTENLYDDAEFFAWSKGAASEAEIAQSVCTGAFVLAKAGMLDNLEVTTFYGSIDGLRKFAPNARVEDGRRFVDNGRIVTTAGVSAGIDGSLNIVARLLGRRVADQVATYMEYHWTPEAYLASKYPYLNPSTSDSGRQLQTGEIAYEAKDFAEAAKIYRGIIQDDPANEQAWSRLGITLRAANDHASAAKAFATAATSAADKRRAASSFYSAAAEYARAEEPNDAVQMLQKAFDAGYPNRNAVNTDPVFAKVKDDPRLRELTAAK
jgi:putative intracellular protease/amidase